MKNPIVSTILFLLTLGSFLLGLILNPESESYWAWQGYFSPYQIYSGAYWAHFTSTFAHFDLFHLIGNIYWLWTFAPFIERKVGWRDMLIGFLLLSFISSSLEFLSSGDTGIGMSGVVYAYFGYLSGKKYFLKEIVNVLTLKATLQFVAWGILCIGLSYYDVMAIGNIAHFSGLATGLALSFIYQNRSKSSLLRITSRTVLGIALCLSFVTLFFNPNSVAWLSNIGYKLHEQEKYEESILLYSRIITLDPDNAWAYYNRSCARYELGQSAASDRDYKKATTLDPQYINEAE